MDLSPIDWKKFVSTEFMAFVFGVIIGTVALFLGKATFTEWGALFTALCVNLGIVRNWQKSTKAKWAD